MCPDWKFWNSVVRWWKFLVRLEKSKFIFICIILLVFLFSCFFSVLFFLFLFYYFSYYHTPFDIVNLHSFAIPTITATLFILINSASFTRYSISNWLWQKVGCFLLANLKSRAVHKSWLKYLYIQQVLCITQNSIWWWYSRSRSLEIEIPLHLHCS